MKIKEVFLFGILRYNFHLNMLKHDMSHTGVYIFINILREF